MKYTLDNKTMKITKNTTLSTTFYLLKGKKYTLDNGIEFSLVNDMLIDDSTDKQRIDNLTKFNSKPTSTNPGPIFTFQENNSGAQVTISLVQDTEQWFNQTIQKKLSEFGNNVYFEYDASRKIYTEITFDDFKIKLSSANNIFAIRFGSKLKHFRDYMFESNTGNKINLNNSEYEIEDIDYENECIRFKTSKPSNTLLLSLDSTISITNLIRYRITLPGSPNEIKSLSSITGKQTIYYESDDVSNKFKMIATYNPSSGTGVLLYAFLNNLNVTIPPGVGKTKKKYIEELIADCIANTRWNNKNVFNKLDYYVSNLASYEIIQNIDDIQKHNLASLKSILGNNTKGKYSMEQMIDEYQTNIGQGSELITHTDPDDPIVLDTTTKKPMKQWSGFNHTNTKGQYFAKTIQKFQPPKSISNSSKVQEVIYKCYELQILYLVKHLEVIFINNIIFYYMDMLAKQVAVLLFILSLYKRYKYDLSQIESVKITDLFKDLSILTGSQKDIIKGKMSGGGNNAPVYSLVEPVSVVEQQNAKGQKADLESTDLASKIVAPAQVIVKDEAPAVPVTQEVTEEKVETAIEKLLTEYQKITNLTYKELQEEFKDKITSEILIYSNENNPNEINKIIEDINAQINQLNTTQSGGAPVSFNPSVVNKEEKIDLLEKYKYYLTELLILKEVIDIRDSSDTTNTKYDNLKNLQVKIDKSEMNIFRILKGKNAFRFGGLTRVVELADFDREISGNSNKTTAATERITKKSSIEKTVKDIEQIPLVKENAIHFQKVILLEELKKRQEKNKQPFTKTEELRKSKQNILETIKQQLLPPNVKITDEDIDDVKLIKALKDVENLILLNKLKTYKIETIKTLEELKKLLTDDTDTIENVKKNIKQLLTSLGVNVSVSGSEIVNANFGGGFNKKMKGGAQPVVNANLSISQSIIKWLEGILDKIRTFELNDNATQKEVKVNAEYLATFSTYEGFVGTTYDDLIKFLTIIKTDYTTKLNAFSFDDTETDQKQTQATFITELAKERIEKTKLEDIKKFIEDNIELQKQKQEVAEEEARLEAERRATEQADLEKRNAEAAKLQKEKSARDINKIEYEKLNSDNPDFFETLLTLNKEEKKVKMPSIVTLMGTPFTNEKLQNCIDVINYYKELTTEPTTEPTTPPTLEILKEVVETNLPKLILLKVKIIEIITNITADELKANPTYKTLILPLTTIWFKITNGTNNLTDVNVINRITTTDTEYKSVQQYKDYDVTLLQLFQFLLEIDKLIAEQNTQHVSLDAFIKKLDETSFKEIKGKSDVDAVKTSLQTNLNTLVTTYPKIIKELRNILTFIKDNIRTIYENVLGAAMVLVRIKPLAEHNSAPTYKEIFNQKEQSSYNFLGKKAIEINSNPVIANYTLRDYMDMKKNKDLRKKLMAGGYKYTDIISFKDTAGNLLESGKIRFGNICGNQEIITDAIIRDKTYGPFAGIYTPEYNNFDIYRYLFGSIPLINDRSSITEEEKNLIAETETYAKNPIHKYNTYGKDTHQTLEQPQNEPQNLLAQKLEKGGNVVLFGFGFSGSGKTYTLIEGQKIRENGAIENQNYDPSLIEQFIKDNSEQITSVEFVDIYPLGDNTLETKPGKNIKIFYGSGIPNATYLPDSSIEDPNYNTINSPITFEAIKTRIEALEDYRRQHLRICATPNNDNSSRSFLQITINLKKGNKLVIFDMPGSENTVRLRTELLGKKILSNFNKEAQNLSPFLQKYQTAQVKINGFNTFILKDQVQEEKIKTYNSTNGNIKGKVDYLLINYVKQTFDTPELDNVFKNCLIDISSYTKQIQNLTNLKFIANPPTDAEISATTQELNLFLNGYTETTIQEYYSNNKRIQNFTGLKILSPYQIKTICLDFIRSIILKEDKGKLKYFNFESMPTGRNYTKQNLFTNEATDQKQFENIFKNITFKSKNISYDMVDITLFKTLDFEEIKKKITNSNNPNPTPNTHIFKDTDVKHPLIKYITFLLNECLIKISSPRHFYPLLLIYIFRYIKFIVDQGEAIVTNLEHLKFFFLSNTFNIEDYNTKNEEVNKKFLFTSPNPLDQKREFTKETTVFPGVILKEKINIGEMNQYRLLSILQNLAGEESDLNKLAIKNDILDLFKLKDSAVVKTSTIKSLFIMFTNIKIFRDDKNLNDKFDIQDSITPTNISNYQLICGAEQDTLEFAQSISSTTQTVNLQNAQAQAQAQTQAAVAASSGSVATAASPSAAVVAATPSNLKRPNLSQALTPAYLEGQKSGGSLTSNSKHSPKKFNMKELTKKHKKQNRISTIKKQLKTNNKKTLFSRRSKKYQE